jgi:hypothetical protein
VREINSEQGLYVQGVGENHCVGGFAPIIEKNAATRPDNCAIYSIEKEGVVLSTLELRFDAKSGGGAKVSMRQNQARGNTTPDPLANQVARQVMRKLGGASQERLTAHFQSVEKMKIPKAVRMTENGVEKDVPAALFAGGYDARDRAAREKAFQTLAPYMPKAWRKDGFEGFERRVYALEDAYNKEKAKERKQLKQDRSVLW